MKTALVIGGSRGIGAAVVRAFARAGTRAVFSYWQSEERARALSHETGSAALFCDAGNSGQVNALCDEAARELGHIDSLVYCAGIAAQSLLTDVTDEEWQRMLNVNLSGAFYAVRRVLPQMISRKSGSIVLVSSMWGQVGASMEVPYSATKAGLIGLGKGLAKEVAPSGVRVNCVAPGVIRTDMTAVLGQETLDALLEETPMGRLGEAEDVARAVVWLCGEEASFVTGQTLGVNGGWVV